MVFNPGFVVSPSEAPVWLIVDSISPVISTDTLELILESQAGTPGLTATLEAWNWNDSVYEVVDVSPASFASDVVVSVDLTAGLSNYVQAGTGAIRSRVGWRKTGFTIKFPWEVRIDQLIWTAN